MTSRERVLAHLDGNATDRLPCMPITMQFASSLLAKPYLDYALDSSVLVAGQLAVADRFAVDHVSAISDPARTPADLGASIVYHPDSPPALDPLHPLLADKTDLAKLAGISALPGARMTDRLNAVADFRNRVGGDLLIEGWIEGPCAQSANLRGLNNLMMDFVDDEPFVRDLMAFVTEHEIEFARRQIEAGADLIGIGDAASSLVGPRVYTEYVLGYAMQMVSAIRQAGARVRLHICGNTRRIVGPMGSLACDIVDIDYPCPLAEARAAMGPDQVLLGNLDPVRVVQDASRESVSQAVRGCHAEAGPRFIVGAGCEVTRDTPHENMRALCDYAASAGASS